MNVIDFRKSGCKRVRPFLDSHLSDELPAETTREVLVHLEACADCRQSLESRRRVKQLLKGAVLKDTAPPFLRERIRQSVRKDSSAAWGRWMMVAAAMLALLVAGGTALRLLNRAAPAAGANARLLEIGLGDHVHCAVDKGFTDRAFTAEQMREKLGPDFTGLVAAVQEKAGDDYKVTVGHRCKFNGREFIHLILKSPSATVSLVVTRKGGESFSRDAAATFLESAGAPIYQAHLKGFEVAGTETRDYLAFVVSDLGQKDGLELASTLAPVMRDFLARREA